MIVTERSESVRLKQTRDEVRKFVGSGFGVLGIE
jgi:hypothetical protein